MFERFKQSKAYRVYVEFPQDSHRGWYATEKLVLIFSLIALSIFCEPAFRKTPDFEELRETRGTLEKIVKGRRATHILIRDAFTGDLLAFPSRSGNFPGSPWDPRLRERIMDEQVIIRWRWHWPPLSFPLFRKDVWDAEFDGLRLVKFETLQRNRERNNRSYKTAFFVSLFFLLLVAVIPWIAYSNHYPGRDKS